MKKIILTFLMFTVALTVALTVNAQYKSLSTFGTDTLRYLEYNFVGNNPYNGKTVQDFINVYELPVNSVVYKRTFREGSTDDLLGLNISYLYQCEKWDATQKYYVVHIYFIPPYENAYDFIYPYRDYEGMEQLKIFKNYIIDRIEIITINAKK
ncbi:MAG: hypothetical protein LUF90_02285 [Rikenellaceae bacterium]|nr:hypothetical protein [Rikenellaceae bacterium]